MKFAALTLALALGLTFSAQAAPVSHTAAFTSGHAKVVKAADTETKAPAKAKKAKKKKKKAAPKHA